MFFDDGRDGSSASINDFSFVRWTSPEDIHAGRE